MRTGALFSDTLESKSKWGIYDVFSGLAVIQKHDFTNCMTAALEFISIWRLKKSQSLFTMSPRLLVPNRSH